LKRLLAAGLLIAAVASVGLTARPVFSQDSGVVNATVTVATPCLTVPSTTINYGTKGFANTIIGDSWVNAAQFMVESCSPTPQSLSARGQAMTGISAAWSLSSAGLLTTCYQDGPTQPITLNRYKHKITYGPPASPTVILLTTSDTVLGTMSAIGTAYNVTPRLYMPCSGSDGVGQAMSTTITFTASY
jgi:hypothetical protein